jgi:hypothetical protein
MATEIDIAVTTTTYDVTIVAEPNEYIVNITTGGGGGSQTLAQTLDIGNQTGGENILVNDADAIELENTSLLKKGSYNFGGNGGISRICSNQYEDMWQNGFRHVFDQSGFIRNSTNCFNIIPDSSFDVTLRFAVGSFWTLDNGTTYICTDNTEGAAVWELYATNVPTLQQVTDEGATTTNDITVSKATGTSFIQVANNDNTLTFQVDSVDGSLIELNDYNNNNYGSLSCGQLLMTNSDSAENVQLNSNFLLLQSSNSKPLIELSGTDFTLTGSVQIKTDLIDGTYTQQLPDKSGTFAMLDDVPTTTSQLTNDGADGVNPFITALDIPTTGQASTLVREVKNMTGATLTKGTVVFISGANGNKALVSKALATTDALSARTFGLLQSNILNNGTGNCVIIGDLSGLDTSSFAEGAQLYLSGVTAGTYTDTRTLAPTHLVYVGKVTRSHPTQGQIEVQIQNGYELEEIHDCQIISPTNNQALIYETSTDLWKNKTIIEDSITNGVTDKAPSQNAVFDALALKQNDLKTFNRTQGVYYFEEFMGNQGGAVTTNFSGVISAVSGGTTRTIQAGVINRTNQQGVIAHLTGTLATNFAGYLYGGSSLFIGTGAISLETYVTIETLSTATDRFYTLFGYILGGNLANLTNGILFTYDEGGVANGGTASTFFRCATINASTRTFTTTSVPVVASQWYKLRIDINNAANSVGFYIDGNLVATHTTNIPATTTALTIGSYIVKTVGTGSRQMQTDYFMYDETFTNPR